MGKPAILFVDDDANVLSGLRRMLHGKRGEWEIVFAPGSEEAMALLKTRTFDVVVSDMRMPKIDGAQLLSFVERESPGTVRIVLSGYSEEASILRTVGPAHRYIAKPCEAQTLVAVVSDAIALRASLKDSMLRTLVSSLRNLPTPSDTYFRLVREIDSPRGSVASVADIIASDVAMTAEVLKLTNSSFFSVAGHVSSPLQAVRMLGVETVKALALSAGLFRQFDGSGRFAPILSDLNGYSWHIAGLARRIAAELKASAEEREQAFSAGMLSQVGALVLLDQRPSDFGAALDAIGENCDLLTAERAIFDSDHPALGGYLLGLWGFPGAVRRAVTYQLFPSEADGTDPVLTALHVALILGRRCPLLRECRSQTCSLMADIDYLDACQLGEKLEEWKAMATVFTTETEVGGEA